MSTNKKIRVLIVDDSLFMREFISASISRDPGIEVVGKASDPFEARDKIIELMPDVMTLDIQMPKMDGISFLRQLMPQFPLPVVVVSTVTGSVFDAMSAGAVDFVNKTEIKSDTEKGSFASELIMKIKIASIAKVGHHKARQPGGNEDQKYRQTTGNDRIIAIGASTGGTEATYQVLKELGNDLPGIVVVQHMPPVFTKLYSERLNETCAMEVREAADGDSVTPGKVLIAPGGVQMSVIKRGRGFFVECRGSDKINGHCPSVDNLFDSIARMKNVQSLGIILTGMGGDGAKGLLAMRKQGAHTIGQNEKTCVVYGMPSVAQEIGAVTVQLPLQDMPEEIYQWNARKTGQV